MARNRESTFQDAKNSFFWVPNAGLQFIKIKKFLNYKGILIRWRFFNFSFFFSFSIFNHPGELGIPIDRGHDADAFGVGTKPGRCVVEEKSGK
jgi:hypothetical protein